MIFQWVGFSLHKKDALSRRYRGGGVGVGGHCFLQTNVPVFDSCCELVKTGSSNQLGHD